MSEIRCEVTRYTVSAYPAGRVDSHLWEIHVEACPQRDGSTLWAVRQNLGRRVCLNVHGEWEHDTGWTDEFYAEHRFSLNEALRLARLAAPDVTVNGRTAREAQHATG